MDEKTMESYFEHISEQILDEDKIVTYKSLSRALGIHVNLAKELLHSYVTSSKSNNLFPVSTTFLLAGKHSDGSFNITIVNESDLKNSLSTFSQVTSEHVYSVHKGTNLKDIKLLHGIDKESKSSNSIIECSKCIVKSNKVKKKSESVTKQNKNVLQQAFAPNKNKEEKVEINPKTKTESSSHETRTGNVKNTSPKEKKTLMKKPSGNIADLFAKATQKTLEKKVKDKPKEIIEVDLRPKEPEPDKSKGESYEKSRSRESLKKRKLNKRKRIQMISDSEESDSSESDVIEEHEIPPPFTPFENEKEDEIKSVPRNKRKKRKVIDKTVMNEDGYLETKKEIVFETDSEPELTEATSKEEKKLKTSNGVQGGTTAKKQSSLLTFFKKR